MSSRLTNITAVLFAFARRTVRSSAGIWVLAWVLVPALASAAVAQKTAPTYFWHPEMAPAGPVVIVVSLDEQRIYVYRNGSIMGAGRISSGRLGYETPTGVYTILQKAKEHHSNLYDDAPMPFMQRLTWDGVAIHAGTLPGHPASHGCIRIAPELAERLFAVTQPGSVVVVAAASAMPATIVHPAVVAPIDLSGQAMPLPPQGEVSPSLVDEGGAPLNIVISLPDHLAYMLRRGQLLATAPLQMSDNLSFQGTVLYVRERPVDPASAVGSATGASWSGYRILGEGPVPEAAQLAVQLSLPEAFGRALRPALVPGTTVLVTDLPGQGGREEPAYSRLLESTTERVR